MGAWHGIAAMTPNLFAGTVCNARPRDRCDRYSHAVRRRLIYLREKTRQSPLRRGLRFKVGDNM